MIETIIQTVADVYGITPEQIKGKSRKAPLPEARRMVISFSKSEKLSHKVIQEALSVSRHNIYRATYKVKDEIMIYAEVAVTAAKIHLKLKEL